MIIPRLKNDGKPLLKLNKLQLSMKKVIEDKIDQEIYLSEEVNCSICVSSKVEVIGKKDRYGLNYTTNICDSCGLIFTSPRMNQSSYNQFYNSEYRKLYVGTKTATSTFFTRQRSSGEKIYNYLLKNSLITNENSLILEIGCGAGGILDFFKEKGHSTLGLDLGGEYIEYGIKNHQLNLKTGTINDIDTNVKYDVIIYSHVLEHILDLQAELDLIKKVSHSNTIVYIEVPGVKYIHKNYDFNILKYFQNAHTYHFSLQSLTNLMVRNDFKILDGDEQIMAVFEFNKEGFEAPIINDYEECISYINYIEKNRKRYPFTFAGIKKNGTKYLLKLSDILGIRKWLRYLKN